MSEALQLNGCEILSLPRCKNVFLLKLFFSPAAPIQVLPVLKLLPNSIIRTGAQQPLVQTQASKSSCFCIKIFLVNPEPPHELSPKKQESCSWKIENLVLQRSNGMLNMTQVKMSDPPAARLTSYKNGACYSSFQHKSSEELKL